MLDLTDPIYSNEAAAREHLQSIRWASGAYCPHCGEAEQVYEIGGKSAGSGLYNCKSCRKKFTVTVGTVFERSHLPLTKWLAAFHLLCSSKKGISAHQIHRMLGITYKSAWFMCHRIREAMKRGGMVGPVGGHGKHVEVDETYIGRKDGSTVKRGTAHKRTVISLVERGGEVRSFHVDRATSSEVASIVARNVSKASTLNTDESKLYVTMGRDYDGHQVVNHRNNEYVKGTATTNTIEGYFSIFKKGMSGVYQHCSEPHLQRYLNEFDFRYTYRSATGIDDKTRTRRALLGSTGKRLTYQQTH